jgi:5-methylcytosine-specific restriction endonuclease McrA
MILPIEYNKTHWKKRKLVREEYVKIQNGLCCHCGNPLEELPSELILKKKINKELFPRNFFKYPIHLHHDHDTGMTIGSVHNKCNAILWQYEGE